MAEELPSPESRKETYLAKAAGMSIEELPTPASREELYLNAIAEGGGGGGTSDFDELQNRPKYNGTEMSGETNIPTVPSVVQSTGTSTTDVMSQNATTSMVFADPSTQKTVKMGANSNAVGTESVTIGAYANTHNNNYNIAIGPSADAPANAAIAMGSNTYAGGYGSVAIGSGASATTQGVFAINTTNNNGYNNSNYRLLAGLYDGQSAHDAATLAQGNTLATDAPTTSTVGVLGQLYTDTTNMHTYQCTAISGDTYTWTQRW